MGTLSMGFPHLTLWSFQNPMTLHFLKFDNSIPWKVTGQNHLKGKQILIYLPFFHPFFVGGWCEQLPVGCCFWCSHDVCCGMKVNFPWLCSLGRSPILVATDLLFCLEEHSFSLIWGKHYPLTNPIIIPGLSYSFTKLDSIGGVCHHPGSKHGTSPQVLRLRYCSKGLNKKFQNKCRNGDEQNGDFHPADSNFRNKSPPEIHPRHGHMWTKHPHQCSPPSWMFYHQKPRKAYHGSSKKWSFAKKRLSILLLERSHFAKTHLPRFFSVTMNLEIY